MAESNQCEEGPHAADAADPASRWWVVVFVVMFVAAVTGLGSLLGWLSTLIDRDDCVQARCPCGAYARKLEGNCYCIQYDDR